MSDQEVNTLIVFAFSSGLMLLLAAFFVVLVYRYQSRLRKKQHEIFHAVLSAQEEERRRIAMDIHDGLGGLLSSGKLLLGEIKEGNLDFEEIEDNIDAAHELVSKAIQEARNASNSLLPDTIKRFGLKGAVNEVKQDYERHFRLNITNNCPNNLEEFFEINIYRLINELLHNAAKYSGSDNVDLQLHSVNSVLYLDMNDNGVGFDFYKMRNKKSGNGLKNMETRVKILGGTFKFNSERGAQYRFSFPIKNYLKNQ